jgi:hypothetical protein
MPRLQNAAYIVAVFIAFSFAGFPAESLIDNACPCVLLALSSYLFTP